MSEIVWLASYPKSGNTWLRAFLANYLSDADRPVDINQLPRISVSDNSARPYARLLKKPAEQITPQEVQRLRPKVHRRIAESAPGRIFVKTHNAVAKLGEASTITLSVTAAALYVLRNPFDVTVSFADHYGLTLDQAVKALNDERNATLPTPEVVFQLLSSWSRHVWSWTTVPGLKLHLLRYEDMTTAPEETFRQVVKFLGLELDPARLERAIRFSSFGVLAEQEAREGFIERSGKAGRFFREGKVGGFRAQLSEEQIRALVETHRQALRRYGYLSETDEILV